MTGARRVASPSAEVRSRGGEPRVGAVVLNWNGGEDTIECLGSLAACPYPALEVRVVDNGSTDGSAEEIERGFPAWPLIRLGANRGQAAGENAGIRASLAAGSDFVFLLNNDAVVEPETIPALVRAARAAGRVGISGPTVYHYPPATGRLWSAGERVLYPFALGWSRRSAGGPITEVDAVQGCAALLSRAALEATGGFDESFHTYFSDIDLCLRARKLGFRILHVGTARAWHKGGRSTGGSESPFVLYLKMRNLLLFPRKHAPAPLLAFALVHAGLFFAKHSARSLVRDRHRTVESMRAMLDGAAWHLGTRARRNEWGT